MLTMSLCVSGDDEQQAVTVWRTELFGWACFDSVCVCVSKGGTGGGNECFPCFHT